MKKGWMYKARRKGIAQIIIGLFLMLLAVVGLIYLLMETSFYDDTIALLVISAAVRIVVLGVLLLLFGIGTVRRSIVPVKKMNELYRQLASQERALKETEASQRENRSIYAEAYTDEQLTKMIANGEFSDGNVSEYVNARSTLGLYLQFAPGIIKNCKSNIETIKEKMKKMNNEPEEPVIVNGRRKRIQRSIVAIVLAFTISASCFAGGYSYSIYLHGTEVNINYLREPDNGKMYYRPRVGEATAPLTVECGERMYVVLTDIFFGRPQASFYVRENSSVTVDIPVGSYEIYFATGPRWYGPDRLFAPNTQYYKMRGIYKLEVVDGIPKGKIVQIMMDESDSEVQIPISKFPC